jgi:hypothetical protein
MGCSLDGMLLSIPLSNDTCVVGVYGSVTMYWNAFIISIY